MLLYLRLLKESFEFAMVALRSNKLRTLLSLLGITIGIFSIIAILTAVDSLDKKIKSNLESLDKNTIYLTSVPFGPSDIPRWKREQFPSVTYDEYQYLKSSLTQVEEVCLEYMVAGQNIFFEKKLVSNAHVVPVTHELMSLYRMEFSLGRFFNEAESYSGKQVVVLGYDIARGLFEFSNPIGKTVRMYGQRFTVIGVIKKKGDSSLEMGGGLDNSAFFPSSFIRKIYGENNRKALSIIVIKPSKNVDIEELKAEIKQKLRNYRGVKQGETDNFFINLLSGFTEIIDKVINSLKAGGAVISLFSLLVGGFGIANIMFVSVKERTNIIGIQKALGAKRQFILFQFLFESVILSLIGGLVGLLFVFAVTIILNNTIEFEFALSFQNIIIGIGLSALIGLISGIIPAISASRLDPVEAIRTGG